jgi:hypothetical protein
MTRSAAGGVGSRSGDGDAVSRLVTARAPLPVFLYEFDR